MKFFISHCEKDIAFIKPLLNLLTDIGVPKEDHIFCSSIPGYKVPNGRDFIEYIRELLTQEDIAVLFVLSDNFNNSKACCMEASAAWALGVPCMLLTLPEFPYNNIPLPFNIYTVVHKLDDPYGLNELKDFVDERLDTPPVSFTIWEQDRERFLQEITGFAPQNPSPPKHSANSTAQTGVGQTAILGNQYNIENNGTLYIDNRNRS